MILWLAKRGLRSKSPEKRRRACSNFELGDVDNETRNLLIGLLHSDTDRQVRLAVCACQSIWDSKDPSVVRDMLAVWAQTRDSSLIGRMAMSATDIVKQVFEDSGARRDLRQAALAVLSHSLRSSNWEDTLEVLTRNALLRSDFKAVRIVIEGSPLPASVVFKRLSDGPSCPQVTRHKASEILGSFAHPPLLDALTKGRTLIGTAYYADSNSLRRAAVQALGIIGDPQAADDLIEVLADHASEVRKEAASALTKLGYPEWNSMVRGDHNDFRRLGGDGDKRVAEMLMKVYDRARAKNDICVALEELERRGVYIPDGSRFRQMVLERNTNMRSSDQVWRDIQERRRREEHLEEALREGR
jgi:hypothetical protein